MEITLSLNTKAMEKRGGKDSNDEKVQLRFSSAHHLGNPQRLHLVS